MSFTYRPRNARLSWTSEQMPFAEDYGDVYYSRADALGESNHVFLDGNSLEQRFRNLGVGDFVIGEAGFGAGLNFLNTCRLWCESAAPAARLHYVACELHPLTRGDIAQVLGHFRELQPYVAALLRLYPGHTIGTHQMQLVLGQHQVSLTLMHDEANAAFGSLARQAGLRVDAWFLDGFSPRTNPAMWQDSLLRHLAVLSHAETTLASYSVAGSVRRALTDAGFECTKAPGFLGKRHMLSARFAANGAAQPRLHQRSDRKVCIVGGGLAGCSTAYTLANAGWQVLLIEQGPRLAVGASGNAQGILHFKPGTVDTPDNRFNLAAYLHATRHYRSLELPEDTWSACGMLQLAHDDRLLKRFANLASSGMYAPEVLQILDSPRASLCGGAPVTRPALYFPDAGWLCPPRLCNWYCDHPDVQVLTAHTVTQLDHGAEGWEVRMRGEDGERLLQAPHVILCNSADVFRFAQARGLPLICNRGQVDLYPNSETQPLHSVICGQGYLVPSGAEGQAVGGSFFLGAATATMMELNRQQHLHQLSGINPQLAAHFAATRPLLQRISERCTLPGRMPVVGALQLQGDHGLWVNVGHGSHGLARTPICASLLASLLAGTPAPLSPDLPPLLSPQRFG